MTVQRTHRVARLLRPALLVTAAAAGLLAAALLLTVIAQAGRILPGTHVAGVDLGGRDPASAQRILTSVLAREERRLLAVSHPGGRTLARPSELGLTFDVTATVEDAFARGREGLDRPLVRLTAPMRSVTIAPRSQLDEGALLTWFTALADHIDHDADSGDLTVRPDTREVHALTPRGGVRVDRAASLEALRDALQDPAVSSMTLTVDVTPPSAPRAAIDALAEQARRALQQPIVLEHEGRALRVVPETLARLIVVDSDRSAAAPRIRIDVEQLSRSLGEQGAATFDRSPERARIETPSLPPTTLTDRGSTRFTAVPAAVALVPATTRTVFVPRRTAHQLAGMIATGERTAEADLLTIDPDVTTATFDEGVPTHLLGTFTTFHPAGTARAANIRRLAELLDGALIAPGSSFSINGTSGPRRCEDGFLPAGTIIRGELVDTCGGGISQFATTLLNAAFFAGAPLERWQPHSFFIGRYPAGREATLTYPELDVRFRNDTDAWMVLRTATTPDSVTASLYGVPTWQEVLATHDAPRDPTPFPEIVRPAADLAPGAVRVVQSGGDGFTIGVRRTRVPLTGDAATVERWRTVYAPQVRIVEISEQAWLSRADGRDGAGSPEAADGASGG